MLKKIIVIILVVGTIISCKKRERKKPFLYYFNNRDTTTLRVEPSPPFMKDIETNKIIKREPYRVKFYRKYESHYIIGDEDYIQKPYKKRYISKDSLCNYEIVKQSRLFRGRIIDFSNPDSIFIVEVEYNNWMID